MLNVLVEFQASIRSVFSGGIDSFARTHDWLALIGLLPIGIVFGAAHALTPGHGKSILAVYAVGSDLSRVRVIATAVALTLTHIGTAVLLAVVTNTIVTRTITGAGQAPALEFVSRTMLVVVALWLIVRAILGRPHIHGESILAGVAAGLIPCPLTLFFMFYALSLGVPEAGLTFAASMLIGVGLVLTAVAVTSVVARQFVVALVEKRGIAISAAVRVVDAAAGILLLLLASYDLLG